MNISSPSLRFLSLPTGGAGVRQNAPARRQLSPVAPGAAAPRRPRFTRVGWTGGEAAIEDARRTNTPEELCALRAAHERFRAGDDILEAAARAALRRTGPPARVLDVGCGTGNGYDCVRAVAGADAQYVGVDVAPSMVSALSRRLAGDPGAEVRQGDAERLDPGLGSFDWVLLHFVLPHVGRPRAAATAAWRRVRPGGVLVAAGNGRRHLERWRALHASVLAEVGLPAPEPDAPKPDLDAMAAFFPGTGQAEARRVPSGFAFPTVEDALAYYGAVMWRRGLTPAQVEDATLRRRLLVAMAGRLRQEVEAGGAFRVDGDSGFVIVMGPRSTPRRRPGASAAPA